MASAGGQQEPNEALARLLVERGWSYRELGRVYADWCAHEGRPARRPSLTTISRWVNGKQQPTPENLYILRRVFGVSTDEQLGFRSLPAADPAAARGDDWLGEPLSERLERALRRPARIDTTLLGDLEQRTRQLDRADRRDGAERTFNEVMTHLGRVAALLDAAPTERTFRRVAVLAGDVAQLAAWLYFDRRDFAHAETYSRLALEAAAAAQRRELGAYAQGQHATITFHRGRPHDAVELAEVAAQATPDGLTGAWLARVEAEARARLGDRDGCAAALDRARHLLAAPPRAEDVPWVAYFADPAHLDRAEGRCLVQLGQGRMAREALGRSLALGGPFVRARGGALAESALAFVLDADPDPDQAALTALEALEITRRTGSRRNLERLREVDARLAPWRSRPAVRELRVALRMAG